MNAETVPACTRPLHAGSGSSPSSGSRNSPSASTSDGRSVMIRSPGSAGPAGRARCRRPRRADRAGRRPRACPATSTANRFSCACTRSRMNGIWLRSVVRVGEQELQQVLVDELARGPARRPRRPPAGRRCRGRRRRRSARAAAPRTAPMGNGAGSTPSAAQPAARLLVEEAVRLVEPQQVLALHVEDQHAQVRGALAHARRAARGQHPQEEQRERGLGGDAADAADRHVAALAAVEEVEVEVHGLAVAADADRRAGGPSRPRRAPSPRSSPVARSTTSPGSGETHTSGSTRVTATRADRTFAAGMMPSSATRWVSDS